MLSCHYPRNRWRYQKNEMTEEGTRPIALEPSCWLAYAASCQRRSSVSARPQERQHSNHPTTRVKWSADSDISESTDDIIQGSSSVLAGDGLVSVTKVDNVHAYSNVNRILLLPNSNLLRSPSTPRRLLILPGLPKDAPFNQPIIRHPWLLALQQRLS